MLLVLSFSFYFVIDINDRKFKYVGVELGNLEYEIFGLFLFVVIVFLGCV